jgi:hypothetical protein
LREFGEALGVEPDEPLQRFSRVSGAVTVANAGVAMASRHDDRGEGRARA